MLCIFSFSAPLVLLARDAAYLQLMMTTAIQRLQFAKDAFAQAGMQLSSTTDRLATSLKSSEPSAAAAYNDSIACRFGIEQSCKLTEAMNGLAHTKHPTGNRDNIQVKSNCVAYAMRHV